MWSYTSTPSIYVIMIIITIIFVCKKIGWDGMDWIDLAQNRDRWRALVNTVMNLRVP
jgi:hypothetical protein